MYRSSINCARPKFANFYGFILARPQFSPHLPLATRHYLLRPSPAGYCLPPTADCEKPIGPDLDERTVHIQYVTETGNSSDKSIRSPRSPPPDR